MNKILKRLVGLFIIGIGILNICNANDIYTAVVEAQDIHIINSVNLNSSSYTNLFNYDNPTGNVQGNQFGNMLSGAGTYCIRFVCGSTAGCEKTLDMGFANGPTTAPTNLYKMYDNQYGNFVCLYGNKPYLNAKLNSSTNTVLVEIFNLQQLLTSELPCPTCQNTATITINDDNNINREITIQSGQQLYINYQNVESIAQTLRGYAINIEECEECQQCQTCPTIDAQYCMNNFNLIPPAYCPICGTGDINWSSLYINGIQYNSNEIIDIHTEDQMETDVDYLNDTVDIDITYGQDENYLNAILSGTAMTPSKEDFSTMLSDGLIAYAPYLFIGLLMIFTIGLIKKFFRG